MPTKRLKWWMLKQRIKLCLADTVIEIAEEIERRRNPLAHAHVAIEDKQIIEITAINKDSVDIKQLDTGQVMSLGVGHQYIFINRSGQ